MKQIEVDRPELSPGCRYGFGTSPNMGQINTQEWMRLSSIREGRGIKARRDQERHTVVVGIKMAPQAHRERHF